MSIADMHARARWRQKVSSSGLEQEGGTNQLQRLTAVGGGLAGGVGGAFAGAGLGELAAVSRYRPLDASQVLERGQLFDELSQWDLLHESPADSLRGRRLAEMRNRLRVLDAQQEAHVLARRAGPYMGRALGAAAGGVGGYYLLKHLARPSE